MSQESTRRSVLMECHDIQEKISAYIEGLASHEEKSMIEEHLKSCQECKTFLADLKKTVSYVKTLEDIEPTAWLSQKIMTRVREEAVPKEGFIHKLFYPLHIKLPVQAIATILIAMSAFYIFKTIQPETRSSKVAVDEMTTPQVLLKDKDLSPKSTKIEEDVLSGSETPQPILKDKVPVRDQGLKKRALRPKGKIAPSVTGEERQRLFLEGKEEVMTYEKSKSVLSEPMEQLYHEKESETPDRYEEVPKTQAPVEKQEALKVFSDVTAKDDSKVGGISLEARKVEREKGKYADITLTVVSLENAQKDIESIVEHLKGKIIKTEIFEDRQVLIVTYDSTKTKELLEQLRLIGEIEGEAVLEEREGSKEISIEILEK